MQLIDSKLLLVLLDWVRHFALDWHGRRARMAVLVAVGMLSLFLTGHDLTWKEVVAFLGAPSTFIAFESIKDAVAAANGKGSSAPPPTS